MKIKINNKNKYPRIILREEKDMYIEVEVEISKGNIKRGKIISISTSGNYEVEIED